MTDPTAAEGLPPSTLFAESFSDRYRGMLLGLALGDLRGHETPLRSGPVGQLVCHTVDALVRAQLRSRAAGVQVAPMDDLRESLLRWGRLQGTAEGPVDGWLARVPALSAHRGPSAAALALPALADGQLLAANDASEAEAMLRTLPIASYVGLVCPRTLAGWAHDVAGMTHGHPEVWSATGFLVVLAAAHLMVVSEAGGHPPLDPCVALRWLMATTPGDPLIDRVSAVVSDPGPFTAAHLREHSPDVTAASVLCGGLYVARHAGGLTLAEARARCVDAGDPHGVSALACSLIGLERGMDALDPAEVATHELGWALDGLARDHISTLWNPVTGSDGEPDPLAMEARYPTRAS